MSANPSEIYTAPKGWTERAFPKLLHYGRTPKGCHFAAWEQPKTFTDEVRASFKSLRTLKRRVEGARRRRTRHRL